MRLYPFSEIVSDVTSKFCKVKASEYNLEGQYKIIDQGKGPVAGYTDRADLVNFELRPVIVFGDHTRIFKYEESPIALGADGAKALRVNPKMANSLYVYYYLRSINIQAAGYSRHFKFLKETKIPIPFKDGQPNFDDQIRIAHLLRKVEGMIVRRKENLKQLDDLLKSIFLEMFSDTSKFAWDTIGNIADKKKKYSISSGPFGSNLTSKHYTNSGVIILRGTNISSGKLKLNDVKYISNEKAIELKRSELRADDVVIIAVGSSGQALKIPKGIPKMIMSQNFNKITPDSLIIDPTYLEYCINSKYVQNQFKKQITDTVRTFLSLTKIISISIPVPPLPLQNQFAAIVEKVEGIKAQYQYILTELGNLYGALSQKAFKGELDLSRVTIKPEALTSLENETEQGVMSEQESKHLIKLSTPDIDQLKGLSEPKVRVETLKQWFQEYFDQIEISSSFSIENFIEAAQKKFWELNQDGLFEPEGNVDTLLDLSPTDYDMVKNWVFRALSDGRIEQTRNQILIDRKQEFGNQIILKKVSSVFTE